MKNLNEQLNRIKSMMGLINEEESDVKFGGLKKMGFEWDYKEEDEELVKEQLYYVIPSTSNCKVMVGFKKSGYESAALAIDEEISGNGLITIDSSKTKIGVDQMCEDVYDEFMLNYIQKEVDKINSQGLNESNILQLMNLVKDKESLKSLSNQALSNYTPPEPKNITKDNVDISVNELGSIQINTKPWVSDKDPNKNFKFDRPLVSYTLFVKTMIGPIELTVLNYNNETRDIKFDLSKCDMGPCKDDDGKPKVFDAKLTEEQRNTIISQIDKDYKSNKNFKEFKLEVTTLKGEQKTIVFQPSEKVLVNVVPVNPQPTTLVQN